MRFLFFIYLLGTFSCGRLLEFCPTVEAITLPGTFLHEGLHYIAALLMGGHPRGFHIAASSYAADGISVPVVGNMLFAADSYNTATVALAPLLLIPLIWYCAHTAAHSRNTFTVVGLLYTMVCLWESFMPSSVDFALASSAPASWPVAISVFTFTAILSIGLFTIQPKNRITK